MTYIFTDGGFSLQRNVGAFAFVVVRDGILVHEHSGAYVNSTNNKMEMKAMYEALLFAQKESVRRFTIVCDSQYVIKSLTEWIPGWKRNDWKTSLGNPVENKEIWELIFPLYKSLPNVTLKWIKGHVNINNKGKYTEWSDEEHKWNAYVDCVCTDLMNSVTTT